MFGSYALGSAALASRPLGADKPMEVIVGDDDRAGKLLTGGLNISESLESRGTCDLSFKDTALAWHPAVGMPVTIRNHGVTRFAGTINDIEEEIPSRERVLFTRLRCVDYNQIADRFVVAAVYENQTLLEIVTDIVNSQTFAWQEGISLAGVQEWGNVDKAVFEYKTLKQCFDDLSEITGLTWKIDHHKVLHFFDRATYTSPWSISDASKKHQSLRYSKTRSRYRNRQFLRAGNDLTDDELAPEVFRGDNVSVEPTKRRSTFSTKYPLGTVPTITKNGVTQRVGVRGVDKDGDLTGTGWPQWFYQLGEKEISQNSAQDEVLNPVLTEGDRLEVDYRGQVPMIMDESNAVEIEARKAVEGGSGVYEHVENDEDLDGRDFAAAKAARLLALYGRIPSEISLQTTEQGLSPGHLMSVVLAGHGINAQFLVDSVRTAWVATKLSNGEPYFEYQVSALDGEVQGGWVDFFRSLADAGRKVKIAENEKLIISRGVRETLTFTDVFTDSVNNSATLNAYTDDTNSYALMVTRTVGADTLYGFEMGRAVMGVPYGA